MVYAKLTYLFQHLIVKAAKSIFFKPRFYFSPKYFATAFATFCPSIAAEMMPPA